MNHKVSMKKYACQTVKHARQRLSSPSFPQAPTCSHNKYHHHDFCRTVVLLPQAPSVTPHSASESHLHRTTPHMTVPLFLSRYTPTSPSRSSTPHAQELAAVRRIHLRYGPHYQRRNARQQSSELYRQLRIWVAWPTRSERGGKISGEQGSR